MKTKPTKRAVIALSMIITMIITGCAAETHPPATNTPTITSISATQSIDTTPPPKTTISTTVSTTNTTTSTIETSPPEEIAITTAVADDPQPVTTQLTSTLQTKKNNLTNESMFMINNLKTSICNSKTYRPYLYNFCNKLTTSMTDDGYLVPIETNLYGIKAEISGLKIKTTVYNNSNKKITIKDSYIEDIATGANDYNHYLKNKLALNKTVYLDTSALPDFKSRLKGYRIVVNLSVDKESKTIYSYFMTNIDEVKLCTLSNTTYSSSQFKQIQKRRKVILDQIAKDKIDPAKQTSTTGIYYPNWHFNNPNKYRCDTDLWSAKAKTIVDSKMSDELKIWTFYNWIMNNIAYDEYKASTDSAQCYSRAVQKEDYSGKQSVYNLTTGVCYDFANVFAIFCRTYNIPCIVISNVSHAWNAIYMNGRWIEIDCTKGVKQYTPKENTNVRYNYDKYDILSKRKCEFDPTLCSTIWDSYKDLYYINEALATDKIYTR